MQVQEFLPLWDMGSCMNFADNSRSCGRILISFVEGWNVFLATDRLILVLVWIFLWIQ